MKLCTPIEVRYQETDQMGIVYHANYLTWFEIGRTKYLEALGFDYVNMEKNGVLVPVIDAHISYKHPVKYGDDVKVFTWLSKYDGVRSSYQYEVTVNELIMVTGETEHVVVKKDSFKPTSLRKYSKELHEAYINQINTL